MQPLWPPSGRKSTYPNVQFCQATSDVVNAAVMNPMIKRWRSEWIMTFRPSEFKIFNNLNALSTEEIEALLRERAVVAKKATNAERLRHERKLALLKDEMDKRFKAHQKSIERDAPGRSR